MKDKSTFNLNPIDSVDLVNGLGQCQQALKSTVGSTAHFKSVLWSFKMLFGGTRNIFSICFCSSKYAKTNFGWLFYFQSKGFFVVVFGKSNTHTTILIILLLEWVTVANALFVKISISPPLLHTPHFLFSRHDLLLSNTFSTVEKEEGGRGKKLNTQTPVPVFKKM